MSAGAGFEILRAFLRAKWAGRYGTATAGPLAAGAIETGAAFEAHFAERNILGLTLDEARAEAARELAGLPPRYPGYSFGFSTGSTGPSGVFLTSEAERNLWLGCIVARLLPLSLLVRGGTKVALVLRFNNRMYSAPSRWLQVRYFDAAAPVDQWRGQLEAWGPDVLIGPVSLLERIGESEGRPRPRLLIAGAEPLYPQDAVRLREAFGVVPQVIYQAKEGFLAASCAEGTLHLNDDWIQFERLQLPRNRFVPVITDMARTSQRYRRFRLDDIVIGGDGGRCTCGRRLAAVSAVEGRAADVLLTEAGPVFPHEVNAWCAPVAGDYRVRQSAPGLVEVAPAELADVLRPRFDGVAVEPAPFAPRGPGEKRRRIERTFDLQNDWLNRFTVSRNATSG